jgi:hypothetical protein
MKEGLSNAYIAWILFKNLPQSFEAYSSRKYEEIGKNLSKLDINSIISDLIAEEARLKSSINENKAIKAKSYNKPNNLNNKIKRYCSHCKKQGHTQEYCWVKNPELKNSNTKPILNKASRENENSSILYSNEFKITKNSFIIDSGASDHYTPYREWLRNYTEFSKPIYIANGEAIIALGYGDIDLQLKDENNSEIYQITLSRV